MDNPGHAAARPGIPEISKAYCFVAGGVWVVVEVPEAPDLVVLGSDLVVVVSDLVVVLVPDAPDEPPLRERMLVVVLDRPPPERISTPVRDLRRSRTTMSGRLRSMITVRPHPRPQRCP